MDANPATWHALPGVAHNLHPPPASSDLSGNVGPNGPGFTRGTTHRRQNRGTRTRLTGTAAEGMKFGGRTGVVYTVVGKGGLARKVLLPPGLADRFEERRLDIPERVVDRGVRYLQRYDVGGGHAFSASFSRASTEPLGKSRGHMDCHSFAQAPMRELMHHAEYRLALAIVSEEMGHLRPDITLTFVCSFSVGNAHGCLGFTCDTTYARQLHLRRVDPEAVSNGCLPTGAAQWTVRGVSVSDYLHECLERHGDVARALYGSSQDLQAIERLSATIIDAGQLTFDHVQTITHAGYWRGGTFWQWPTREEFSKRSKGDPVEDLWQLPRRQNAIVEKLLRIFRHIEPVSVVLRFIDPRNFGILSPPVEKILEIGPAHRPREKYLKYVKDLRTLRQERHFATAAEVDMALWVMHEVIDASRTRSDRLSRVVPEADHWIRAFWADRTLREIRVTNLTSSLFGTMTMADFAEALLPRDARRTKQDQIRLAGRIAAIEFELAVMAIHRASSGQSRDDRGGFESLREIVHMIDLPTATREQWLKSVDIRNDAVHGNRLTRDDVEELLRTMRAALDELSRQARFIR